MNNDLISRDELPKKAEEWLNGKLRLNYRRMKDALADPGERESPRQDWLRINLNREKQIIVYMLGGVNKAISNYVPIVAAEPVRHGRWIDEGEYITTAYGHLDIKRCSCCNREIVIDDFDNYCPCCGAKMDGGEDNG